MKTLLLYGDSLVFGRVPDKTERYPYEERIGTYISEITGHRVIDEGLRGRTLSGENSFFKDRNGLKHFNHVIGSHLPVDWIVVLLGTNDANSKSNSYSKVSQAIRDYHSVLDEWCKFLEVPQPKVYFCIPPMVNKEAYSQSGMQVFGQSTPERLATIQDAIRNQPSNSKIDLSMVIPVTGDGVHLSASQNKEVAEIVSRYL